MLKYLLQAQQMVILNYGMELAINVSVLLVMLTVVQRLYQLPSLVILRFVSLVH